MAASTGLLRAIPLVAGILVACGEDSSSPLTPAATPFTDAGESPGADATISPGNVPTPCPDLDAAALGLEGTTIQIAESVTGGTVEPFGAGPIEGLAPFCRIAGTIEPAVEFEVWLPAEGYNGRLLALGNAAMAGSITFSGLAVWMSAGYAVFATDTGHKTTSLFDASWALGRPDLIEDFGHRSLHATTENAKKITAAFYGEPAAHAYYSGCSKGGQQGLMEAQRYPEDFDGILVGCPAHDWTRFYAGGHLWIARATLENPESYFPADKLSLLTAAVNLACDAADEIEDGVISDPQGCVFDPQTLACAAGQDASTCFTQSQIDTLIRIYAAATTPAGQKIFPGLFFGSESEWAGWVTGASPGEGLHFLAANDFFRYMVFEDPNWNYLTFDFDADLAFAINKVGRALDASAPDLSAFRDRGGKLLVYHGLSDPDISPQSSIDYHEAVTAFFRGPSEVDPWYRLFLVPGMGHCGGGPGPGIDTLDAQEKLEAWVENDGAPERLLATKTDAAGIVTSRPLCPHPARASWNGSGDTNSADSFDCITP